MKNRIVLFFTINFILATSLYAQGGWNIGYIHVDSISEAHVGRIVKIDFAGNGNKLGQEYLLMDVLSEKDTGTLVLCENDTIIVTEKRNIFADWGIFKEQYLESTNYLDDDGILFRTKQFVIQDVQPTSVDFELHASILKRRGRKTYEIGSKVFHVRILRETLNGLMYEIESPD